LAVYPRIVVRESDLTAFEYRPGEDDEHILRSVDGVASLNPMMDWVLKVEGMTPQSRKLVQLHDKWRARLAELKAAPISDVEKAKRVAKTEWLIDHFRIVGRMLSVELK
jgi:hypothetical protein